MQYGKLTNGTLETFKGKSIRHNGRIYVNPTEETLKELGYKPVIETEPPEIMEGYYISVVYTEDDDNIYVGYEQIEIPDEEITEDSTDESAKETE